MLSGTINIYIHNLNHNPLLADEITAKPKWLASLCFIIKHTTAHIRSVSYVQDTEKETLMNEHGTCWYTDWASIQLITNCTDLCLVLVYAKFYTMSVQQPLQEQIHAYAKMIQVHTGLCLLEINVQLTLMTYST